MKKIKGHYKLKRRLGTPGGGGWIDFYVDEKFTGTHENLNVQVEQTMHRDLIKIINGKKTRKKNWYSIEKAREVWREKRLLGWQTSEEYYKDEKI